jgi:hypothetical protein
MAQDRSRKVEIISAPIPETTFFFSLTYHLSMSLVADPDITKPFLPNPVLTNPVVFRFGCWEHASGGREAGVPKNCCSAGTQLGLRALKR